MITTGATHQLVKTKPNHKRGKQAITYRVRDNGTGKLAAKHKMYNVGYPIKGKDDVS